MPEYARFLSPPFDINKMTEWHPKLKFYPHFDDLLTKAEILRIVKNPAAVAQNSFFPFILFNEQQDKFGGKKVDRAGESRPVPKLRPIRYAARRDSYIFAYYRYMLAERYEEVLAQEGLQDTVIAYRKIADGDSNAGKCNIHFARDAFADIQRIGNSYAVALDISDFFGSINHVRLKQSWARLIGYADLPPDHAAVYKAITQYADVDYHAALERLGYIGSVTIKGVEKKGYLIAKKCIPFQLCSPADFRKKICGSAGYAKLINKEKGRTKGIPQGSPISDLLANLYLLDFDRAMKNFANANHAVYRRYSDDILFLCPDNEEILHIFLDLVKEKIAEAGEELAIKDSKTVIKHFVMDESGLRCKFYNHDAYPSQREGSMRNRHFEYLGFSFDGVTVKLKDSTVSRYYRKMKLGIRSEARSLVNRYPDRDISALLKLAKISQIYQKYGAIDEFSDLKPDEHNKWNFMTYALRATHIMKPFDNLIMRQVRRHKKLVMHFLQHEITKAKIRKNPVSG